MIHRCLALDTQYNVYSFLLMETSQDISIGISLMAVSRPSVID